MFNLEFYRKPVKIHLFLKHQSTLQTLYPKLQLTNLSDLASQSREISIDFDIIVAIVTGDGCKAQTLHKATKKHRSLNSSHNFPATCISRRMWIASTYLTTPSTSDVATTWPPCGLNLQWVIDERCSAYCSWLNSKNVDCPSDNRNGWLFPQMKPLVHV